MPHARAKTLVAIAVLIGPCPATRLAAAEADDIARLMGLRPGMRVADVGAGDGSWSEAIARRVGKTGHVYVNEVDDGELIKIRKRLRRSDLENMSVVVGEPDDTMLPESCCDAILLRFVYHHMSRREPMRRSLHRSLRPRGTLLIVEKDQRGHGIGIQELIAELTADGFEVVSRHPRWQGDDDHYAVVLRDHEAVYSGE